MEWHKLLSDSRLCSPNARTEKNCSRSPFQQDIDRITFSAAFRRLAHKTQVHPLSRNDHVHTRLTHSIEVASVGRSLGTGVGAKIADEISPITQDMFGYVVQAACLAHDIGNPPFGHFGEHAIQS
jgi:dGTPase